MGLIVPTTIRPERADQPLPYEWFVGIDWGSQQHQVCVLDRDRRRVGERAVDHDGASLARLADWLWGMAVGQPQRVAVAIEVPRGAIVEGLLERGFHLFALNPKQLDRFRDRHSVAGAKDDRRDAFVLADSLRTDQPSFRRLQLDAPQLLLLRELSRAEETLLEEFRRSANRLRDQLHRFYPQMLQLCSAADAPWLWDLLDLAPTPAHAALLSAEQVQRVLKAHRLRRITAPEALACLQAPALPVAPGATEAAQAHCGFLLPCLRVLAEQLRACGQQVDALLRTMADEPGAGERPSDVAIVLSLPGVGRKTANLVLILAHSSQENICVDTHVHRISNRMGWVKTRTPDETEQGLYRAAARRWWPIINLYLVTWGQNVCRPVYPLCPQCVLVDVCPKIGVTKVGKLVRRPEVKGGRPGQ